jgi:hypothetical protein
MDELEAQFNCHARKFARHPRESGDPVSLKVSGFPLIIEQAAGMTNRMQVHAVHWEVSTNIQQHSTTTRSDLDEFNPQ